MLPGVDLQQFLIQVSYLGIFAIIFLESCLLFFLPGDSLLFTAGFLAFRGDLSLPVLMVLVLIGAVGGNSLGYLLGQRVGRRLFSNPRSKLFQPRHLDRAHAFYERHGGKTIVWARFVPVVRTFAPLVAGMGEMTYARFVTFNVLGGALWTVSMLGGGYLFGSALPAEAVDKYLLPVIAVIVIVSLLPTAFHVYQERRSTSQ
jgi:membrane-associated protein